MTTSFDNCRTTMKKFFASGLVCGMIIDDKMAFIDWRDVYDWARKATKNTRYEYVALELTNVKTDEIAYCFEKNEKRA